ETHWWFAGFCARRIDERTEAPPNRRTQTGSSELLHLTIENDESAGVRVCNKTYIGDEPLIASTYTGALLPARTLEEDAVPAATSRPRCFAGDATGAAERETCAAYSNDDRIR